MKRVFYTAAIVAALGISVASCGLNEKKETTQTTDSGTQQTPYEPPAREQISYRAVNKKDSIANLSAYDSNQKMIIMALNRMDAAHAAKADTLIIPDKFIDFNQYSPYPFYVPELKDVKKVIFFSYPAQAFGAYEQGKLVKWGPTNMGRQKDQTPTGLFFANWKAEETRSTFDDEWLLKWNFNIENKLGVGWHQYEMPGYPASHSCLRLLESDARYLYDWADQWVLKGTDNVQAKGTPVIVFGSYPFGSGKPWFAVAQNAKAMDISADQMKELVATHLQTILKEQTTQEQFRSTKTADSTK
ncbi:MAG: murein L,D-transpeptidase [Sphingobacteriales bacterium]|nr:MAG: murein L,D-transpeptidase [Sphingobacteriales bacterium]